MKKISIVGVEGSGKTVLLSTFGDMYENPDASGVFMSPENQRAFGFTALHMHAMRNGEWPPPTISNSNLDWTLFRKTDDGNEAICKLSLLDFAGELYRLCFGEHTEEELGHWGEDPELLKTHIAESDILVVIVNLSDVINATPADSRYRETMWLTKSVIDYATRNGNSKEVAIVFSQADIYKSEIESCGGNQAALKKYLPHVANVYGNLPVLAVSAVNKTVPDKDSGLAVPAKDFGSDGLEELMEWIMSKIPGYEDFAQGMKELRLAPIHLWQEASDLYAEYQASLSSSTENRCSIACTLQKKLLELRTACEKFPKNAPASDELQSLEDRAYDILDFESKANEVMSLITYSNKDAALRRLEEYAQENPRVLIEKERLEQEINSIFIRLKGEHSASVRKGVVKAAVSIVVVAGLATAGWLYHEEQERFRQEREIYFGPDSRKGVQLWEGGPYWADRNIGAEKPEDYGYYFWWGDTIGYKREDDKWVASDGSSRNFEFERENTPTYDKDKSQLKIEGWINDDGVLVPKRDAAQAHWGGEWRMPTNDELEELENKCDWKWTKVNGIRGYVVRGRGRYASLSIFLPAASHGYGTSLYKAGSYGSGSYWSSVPNSDYCNARSLNFNSGSHYVYDYNLRYYGQSVRAVQGFTE